MRKKKVLMSIYSVVMIVALGLLLVFQSVDESANEIEYVTANEVYADSLILNCADTISVSVGTSFEMTSGFIEISPASANEKLSCTISPLGDADQNGLVLNDSTYTEFTAMSAGNYGIEYSVPKSKNNYVTGTIVVEVVEDAQTKTSLQSLKINESVAINELLNLDADADVSVVVDDSMLVYENYQLTPISEGETEIEVSVTKNYIKYTTNYLIDITPKYTISISDIKPTGKVCEIYYEILSSNPTEVVDQTLIVDIDNENVQILTNLSPILRLKSSVACTAIVTLRINGESEPLAITIKFE